MRLLWYILIVSIVNILLVFDLLFILFRIALWPSAGKELSPWLFICAFFILVPSKLNVSHSHLVFGTECRILLYRFLIISFLTTSISSMLVRNDAVDVNVSRNVSRSYR